MKIENKKEVEEFMSKNFVLRFIVMTFFIFLLAINFNLFLLSNELVVGGTSGIATLLNKITGVAPATIIFVFNGILIVLSFILLGAKSTASSIIGSIMYPLFVSITSGFCAYLAPKIVINDFLITVILTGLIYGTCNGFIYKTGFTTGGIDILIKIINKYLKIPSGNASLLANVIIVSAGGFIFGLNKAIYAIIIILINSSLIDKIMLGISNSKTFFIRTNKPEKVKKFLREMNSGYTVIDTITKHDDNDMIMCVVNNNDYYMFTNVIKQIDPNAFFIISDCYQVYGGRRKQNFPFI